VAGIVCQALLVPPAAMKTPHPPTPSWIRNSDAVWQGLTLVHFSAQLEPCLTHKNTLRPLNTT